MVSFWNRRRYIEGYSHVYGRFAIVHDRRNGHLYFEGVPALKTITIDCDALESALLAITGQLLKVQPQHRRVM